MRRLLLLAVVALASAGCPDSVSLRCPANSVPSGSYGLVLTLQHTPDECVQIKQADGGPFTSPDGSLVPFTQGPQQSILCAGTSDGGPALYLVAGNGAVRQSPFDADGGFTFVSPTVVQTQTVCGCVANLDETITGTLLGAGAGGFAVSPDGGLVPQPTGIDGSVVQVLTSDAGDCICALGPGRTCAEHFALAGTPNR